MRWAALILGLGSAALFAFLLHAQLVSRAAQAQETAPASGMSVLDAFACRFGETRRTAVRGVEDGFADGRAEPASGLHPRLKGLHLEVTGPRADYDSHEGDRGLSQHFSLPRNLASAMLVIRLRPIGNNLNDNLVVGDISGLRLGGPAAARRYAVSPMTQLERKGWKRSGEVYWVDVEKLLLQTGGTVLDLVRSGPELEPGKVPLDVQVSDDTAVDFMALAWCETPAKGKGMTLDHRQSGGLPDLDAVAFECRPDDPGVRVCDFVVGDTPCDRSLPLLCFRDLDQPGPDWPVGGGGNVLDRRWSGGEVAGTSPVPASRFRTIGEADRHCAATFGRGWRVADWHEGGSGYGFGARAGGRTFSGRYWADIRGSPYGTCWSRNHGR